MIATGQLAPPPTRARVIARLLQDPVLLITLLAIFSLIASFVAYPILKILYMSFFPQGKFSLETYRDFVTKPYLLRPFLNSLHVAVYVAVIGTLIAFVFAYALNRTDMRFKTAYRLIALMPIISPPFVISIAAIILLGKQGLFTKLLNFDFHIWGFNGLILTETLSYFPVAFITLEGILRAIDPALEEAGLNLGASRWRVFWTVTLPLAMPGVASALLLLFIESLADFGNPMVIGANFSVLSAEAYLAITGQYNLPLGISLSIMLLFPPLVAFLLQRYWVGRRSRVTVTGRPSSATVLPTPPHIKYPLVAVATAVVAIILLFYGAVLVGSFTKFWGINNELTLANYKYAFELGWDYIKDTLQIAAGATPVAGLLGLIIAFVIVRKHFRGKAILEFSSMLTFALPGTVVGIGYVLAFNPRLSLNDVYRVAADPIAKSLFGPEAFAQLPFDVQLLPLTGTALIIGLVFVFREMPVGIRAGIASLQQIDPAIEEASTNLGAGTVRTFARVVFPLISPAFFAGLAYAFVKCLTSISAVVFLVSGKWNLITVAILGVVDQARYSHAAALSMIVIAIALLAITLMWFAVGRSALERVVR